MIALTVLYCFFILAITYFLRDIRRGVSEQSLPSERLSILRDVRSFFVNPVFYKLFSDFSPVFLGKIFSF